MTTERPAGGIEGEGDLNCEAGQQGLPMHSSSVGPVCAPAGFADCEPQITRADPTEFELVNNKKPQNFIMGQLRGDELEFWVENLPKDGRGCSGWWMFQQMMAHFGAANVQVILGIWKKTSDNLAAWNSLTAVGTAPEEAAKQTRTGGYAASPLFGYTKVEVVYWSAANPAGTKGAPGRYTQGCVRFKK